MLCYVMLIIHLVYGFCVFFLPMASLFILYFFGLFSRLFWVVSTIASDCLKRLVSEMAYYASRLEQDVKL